ncbi:MAG: Rrf2 family transcriptional regulator [Nostocaceae cyanobacterium]|nr:Rrf2 family transcriptional regulator [Nostocaceae cyanobacterium]
MSLDTPIANSASTNPTVIRRILSMLAEVGIISSQLGCGWGNGKTSQLASPFNNAVLTELYQLAEWTMEAGTGYYSDTVNKV